jgi:hypothetical protein
LFTDPVVSSVASVFGFVAPRFGMSLRMSQQDACSNFETDPQRQVSQQADATAD